VRASAKNWSGYSLDLLALQPSARTGQTIFRSKVLAQSITEKVVRLIFPEQSNYSGLEGPPVRPFRLLPADFKRLDPGTQRTRRPIVEHAWDEASAPVSGSLFGNCPID
jgi:hypothetical protein